MLGRLGNNLFQYALGRFLSEKHGVPLVMDGSWFNKKGWEQVKCIKNLPGPAAGQAQIIRRISIGSRALLKLTGRHYWEYRGVPVFREKATDQSFDSKLMNSPSESLLFGYFQTPFYFGGIEQILRNELSTTNLGLETGFESISARLRSDSSVAVHVRRTDYIGSANLDLCDIEYYRRAMAKLRKEIVTPRFFIFSDDPSWCIEHFTDNDSEVVLQVGNCPLVALHLMSLASHHIIANSSFSWWAAWLGKKSGQHVLMPAKWMLNIQAPIAEKQCPGWIVI